ncbi:methyl methanesulfonate sensitivity 4 [Rhodnius prolixus]|uniref:methyl methanesulfonate sensitivity 4 n=1 Tax=Rhodnius prolixus TaxID=13249 RepID=UPI003D18E561
MSDPIDIVSISSSPPSSPFPEFPTTFNKVSEMCEYSDKSEEGSPNSKSLGLTKNIPYQYLSDSDDGEEKINTIPSPKLTKKSRKLNVTESVLERKRLEKEIKAKEKAEKAKEKADRAVLLAKIRQSKPDQCMKYITVILDEDIATTNIVTKALELFKDVEFKYKTGKQREPFSVTWIREEPGINATISEEKHILFIWPYDKLVTSVKYCTLIDTFREIKNKYSEFRIYLAIYGYGEYCRKASRKSVDESSTNAEEERVRKKRKTLVIPRIQVDTLLCELEVLLKVSVRFLKNHHEISVLLQQITKAIAETPHRKEIEKRDMEKCWYARGDSRDCIKVDKDFNGLHRLWLQQLSQFNKSSLDIAKAIAEIYPSPFVLYQKYQKLPTQKEREQLLQDIQIIKGGNSRRRLGPELSRKISLLFSQENGEIFLSQE